MKIALKGKLIIGFGIAMIGIAIVAYQGIASMDGLNTEINQVEANQFRPATLVADANVALLSWNEAVLTHIIATSAAVKKRNEDIADENRQKVQDKLDEVSGIPGLTEEDRSLIKQIREGIDDADDLEEQVIIYSRANNEDAAEDLMDTKLRPIFNELDKDMSVFLDLQRDQLNEVMDRTDVRFAQDMRSILILSGVTFAIVVLVAGLLILSITRPINSSIETLAESAGQVSHGSERVSKASLKLAESTAQQASVLEQSSASIEEVAAMTQNNSKMSDQGFRLAEECSSIATRANTSMSSLKEAIERINTSSEKTGRIVKDIDEIAFQTNILSLNAAVEAARAGQAGKGFAVVAEEVRNLALRAAEAARNTTDLIDGSRKSINEGFTLTQATERDFGELTSSVGELKRLVGEINRSSREQAGGIQEINRAIESMNDDTQFTVTASEQSANAAEELSLQARNLMTVVDDLSAIVGRIERKRRSKTPTDSETRSAETESANRREKSGQLSRSAERISESRSVRRGPAVAENSQNGSRSRPQPVYAGNGTGSEEYGARENGYGQHEAQTSGGAADQGIARAEDIISLEDDEKAFREF